MYVIAKTILLVVVGCCVMCDWPASHAKLEAINGLSSDLQRYSGVCSRVLCLVGLTLLVCCKVKGEVCGHFQIIASRKARSFLHFVFGKRYEKMKNSFMTLSAF